MFRPPCRKQPMADNSTSSSTRTTTKSYAEPSGAPAGALGQFLGKNAQLEGLLNAATGATAEAAAASGTAAERAGASAASSAIAGGEIEARKTEQRRSVADAFDLAGVQQDALVQLEQARKERDDLGKQILEDSQVAVWDDPLRWITTQLNMPKMVARHNAANMQARDAVDRIDTVARQVAAAQNITLPDVADQQRQQAAGQAAALAFQGIQQSKKALEESNSIRANGIMQMMQSNRSAFEAKIQIARMFQESEMASRSDREVAALKPALDRYNTKMAAIGQPGYTMEEFKFLSPQKRSDVIEYGNNVPKSGSVFAFGDDPGDSLRQIVQRGGAPTVGQAAPHVFRMLVSQLRSKDADATRVELQKNPKFASAPSAEQDAMVLTALATKQATAVDGKKFIGHNQLDDTNPYKLKLGNAAANPVLEQNLFAQEVRERLKTAPLQKLGAEDLFESLVAKAKVHPDQMQHLTQQFSEFFKEGTEGQWITSGAAQVAYPRPMEYKIAGVGEPDPKQGVNTYSPAEILHAVTKRMVADKRANSTLGVLVNRTPGVN